MVASCSGRPRGGRSVSPRRSPLRAGPSRDSGPCGAISRSARTGHRSSRRLKRPGGPSSPFESLQLLDQRLDPPRQLAPLALPIPLLLAQRLDLGQEPRHVLALELLLALLGAARQLVAL